MPLLGSRDGPMENPKDVFDIFRLLFYMLFAPFIDAIMECTGSPCPLNMQQLIQVTNLLIPIVMILTLIGGEVKE